MKHIFGAGRILPPARPYDLDHSVTLLKRPSKETTKINLNMSQRATSLFFNMH